MRLAPIALAAFLTADPLLAGVSDPSVVGATDGTAIGNVGDRLKVDAVFNSTPSVSISGSTRKTYSASSHDLLVAALATDVFTITGSGTKTVHILYVEVSCTAASGTSTDYNLLMRSTANTLGTSTSQTAVPMDSNNAAATATVKAYTANPTTGTLVGNIRAQRAVVFSNVNQGVQQVIWDFGFPRNAQAVVLRGTSQVLAVNFNGSTIVTGSCDISVEWLEE